jgi:hypothetical protein
VKIIERAISLVALLSFAAVLAADAPREVGCIKTYAGSPTDYQLLRVTGDTVEVQPMLPLFDGDQITVKPGAPPIILSLSGKNSENDELVVCDVLSPHKDHAGCKAASPFRVTSAATTLDQKPNSLDFVISFGKWLVRERERESRITRAELRDSEIHVPLLDMGNAHIVEGTRTFYLAWRGCNPSTFSLARHGEPGEPGEVVFTTPSSLDPQKRTFVRRERLHLRRGQYLVRVSCDQNKEIVHQKALFVVGQETIPQSPDFTGGVWPPDLQRVAQAGWLAQNADESWRLEAFLEIADLPDDLGPAAVLRNALADGQ